MKSTSKTNSNQVAYWFLKLSYLIITLEQMSFYKSYLYKQLAQPLKKIFPNKNSLSEF